MDLHERARLSVSAFLQSCKVPTLQGCRIDLGLMKFDDQKKEGIRVGNSVYTLRRQPQGLPLQYEHGFSSRYREEVRFKSEDAIGALGDYQKFRSRYREAFRGK